MVLKPQRPNAHSYRKYFVAHLLLSGIGIHVKYSLPSSIPTTIIQYHYCDKRINKGTLNYKNIIHISSIQLLSRVQLFVDPMDCSMPGFPVHHQLPEFTQTHIYQVDDAIQPPHPPSSPSPPTFNLSQHQGLFK